MRSFPPLKENPLGSSTIHRSSSSPGPSRPLPTLRPGAAAASSYDIIPYVAAPHATSINAFCATPCMRWIFTGGNDGYIRKFDWFNSINGKTPLTVAQRHPFVDSVTRVRNTRCALEFTIRTDTVLGGLLPFLLGE